MDKKPYKILLIEQDLQVANQIVNWVGKRAEILHVADKSTACEQASLTCWDLVITDMNIPQLNDLDITLIVKKANPITAVLIVTADKKVNFIISAMQNHADGLMFKPLEAKEFLAQTMHLAKQSRCQRLKDRKIILAIGAHPDDVEIGCAGALAKHRTDGDLLHILTLSSGEVGGNSIIRKQESEAAAKFLDAHLFMGDFIDTEILHSLKTIQFIEDVVQQVKPTHVYTHSFHDNHQDHRNTYHSTITACRQISNIYCYQSPSSTVDFRPNVFINIDEFIGIKLLAVSAFASQSNIRPYMRANLIKATARYWGRFCNYHLTEPLEVLKGHA